MVGWQEGHLAPCVGPGHTLFPLLPPCPFTSSSFALFFTFLLFPFHIRFTYFLFLSIPSLYFARVVPLHFQAGGHCYI